MHQNVIFVIENMAWQNVACIVCTGLVCFLISLKLGTHDDLVISNVGKT